MAGNKEGARKAAEKNLASDPNFYKNIGGQSWKNPERSRKTGFALLKKEKHLEISKKGGQKTKEDYKTNIDSPATYTKGNGSKVGDEFTLQGVKYKVALTEEIDLTTEVNQVNSGVSE